MYDPDRYREKAEIAAWRERDPIESLVTRMRQDGELTDPDLAALEAAVADELAAAEAAAQAAGYEPVEELTRFVYSEVTR
jgi:pyruvate dehydrogenase E1 component alpha subunit